MSEATPPPSRDSASQRGWRDLEREQARAFRFDFAAIRTALRRHEFVGSVLELFAEGMAGVARRIVDPGGDERTAAPDDPARPADSTPTTPSDPNDRDRAA